MEMTTDNVQRRGMLLMLASVALFSLMDAGLKLLSAHYPPFQVAALRGLSSLPLVLAWALWTVGPRALLRVRWPLHLLRGVLGIAPAPGAAELDRIVGAAADVIRRAYGTVG